jgi:fucose permease
VGNWGFGYLVEGRDVSPSLASWTVSAYWFGLTVGRFVISPVTTRLGLTKLGLGYVCMAGVVVATLLSFVLPLGGFVALGFFLGPIFPTAISVVPELIEARLVPTAIGVMNGGSVIGGSALPWLAGAIGQGVGVWTLLPFTLALGLVQWLVWWGMASRVRVPVSPVTSSTG